MSALEITGFEVFDVRFPTSKSLDGSDAMNLDPDYSGAYLRFETNDPELTGNSLVFSLGRGTDVQLAALSIVAEKMVGKDVAQSFTNNWVNGSLYMFPIQVDTYYDDQNKPLPPQFAKELVYFDEKTNNFYYRSSPYLSGSTVSRFIGRPTNGLADPVNSRNLLFPTTIINLGVKSDVYKEIVYDASTNGYIMNSLNPSSYSDTSDLVNLFVTYLITVL